MPYPPGLYGYLTERGTLFSNGKIPTDSALGRTPSKAASHWSGLERPDSLGRREANPHYDGSLLKNGNVRNGMLRNVAGIVRGGLLHRFRLDGWHNRYKFT